MGGLRLYFGIEPRGWATTRETSSTSGAAVRFSFRTNPLQLSGVERARARFAPEPFLVQPFGRQTVLHVVGSSGHGAMAPAPILGPGRAAKGMQR